MKNPENLIYIILIVGSFVWSIIKKITSKKETTQPQPNQTPQPKRSLEDIFRDLAGEFDTQPVPQPVAVKQTSRPMMNDALASEKHIVPRQPVTQEEVHQRNFEVNLEDVNDWQRAFVYSEIFNKRY